MKAEKLNSAETSIQADWLWQWIPIALILLLAAGLYFYQLGTESLWVDELYSVNDAKGLPARLNLMRPLYYILLWIWMQFGTSDAWLRGLSVLFGLGSVFLTYQLGHRVAGKVTGLIAALLLALSPLFINFAQMVRMYTLGTCLGLGGTLALVHALENPTTTSMAWWASLRLLVTLTAPLNATLIFADIWLVWFRFRKQRATLLAFGRWLLLVILFCLPSLFTLVSATLPFLSNALNLIAKIDPSATRHSFPSFVDVLRKLKNFTAFPFPSTSKLSSLFYQAYSLLLAALIGIAIIHKNHKPRLCWIAAWAFIPSGMIFLVSKRLWIDRYILFLSPYILIILAAGLMGLWRWKRSLAIAVAIIYTITVSSGLIRYYTVQDRQDWRNVAQTISINEKPADTIVLSIGSPKMTSALGHYYSGDAPIYSLRKLCPSDRVKKPVVEEALNNLPPIPSRLWLVCGTGFDDKKFRTVFKEHFQLETHQAFTNENFYRQNDLMHLFLVIPTSPNSTDSQNPTDIKNKSTSI